MIYLDNAATTFPKPSLVKKSIEGYFTKYGGNPGRSGHKIGLESSAAVFEVREAVSEFFGCDNTDNTVFTLNCTYANNLVINGLLRQGDHVIISDSEHNSTLRPVHLLAKKGVISYDIAKTYTDNTATINSFKALIKPNTKLIVCMHASNVSGEVFPIANLGKMCKENKIYFLVDAAQSAGILDIDVKRDNIDFLSIAAHKGLYSTTGVGVLIANKPEALRSVFTGGSGSVSTSFDHPDFMPDKLECGTANTLGIISLGAGLKFVKSMGRESLYHSELALVQKLYSTLKSSEKITLYTDMPEVNTHVPLMLFNVKGLSSEQVCLELDRMGIALRGGLHCSPLCHKKLCTGDFGGVRVSPAAFNTEKDILFLEKAIKNL